MSKKKYVEIAGIKYFELLNYRVSLNIVDPDIYGRKVAVLYLPNGKAVQPIQVKNGWAYPYEQYKSNCPIWNDIVKAEKIAEKNKLNLYDGGNYEKPWEWIKN